jgi:hypothetical protein
MTVSGKTQLPLRSKVRGIDPKRLNSLMIFPFMLSLEA